MRTTTNNTSYKDRNRNKIKTLIGNDEIFQDILTLKFEVDGKEKTLAEILDEIIANREEIEELKAKNTELKQQLKKYITQENEIDRAITAAVDLLTIKVAQCEESISELKEKTRYL